MSNKPEGLVWHDDEQPQASYPEMPPVNPIPGTCRKCGRETKLNFCGRCQGKLIRHGERNKKIYGSWVRW
jgi:hypothetical protein